jgi:hypothetical protein
MARIPFLAVRLRLEAEDDLVARLRAVAERRRLRSPDGGNDPSFRELLQQARDLLERRRQRAGTAHLRQQDAIRLAALKGGVELVELAGLDAADAIAAAIHAEMPWRAPATELVWHALRRAAAGRAPVRLPPLLLVGPPGIGKSHWARRLAGHLRVPEMAVEATAENAGFGLTGLQAGWGSARTGRVLELILQHRIANPVIFVDEIEKSGSAVSTSGRSFDLAGALLPLLERETARAWTCPYFRVGFDMSWISWILAANSLRGLPEPLLSRCQVVRLPPLSAADLRAFAHREAARRGLSEASTEAILDTLTAIAPRAEALSLRTVLRMLERAAVMEGRPMVH